MGSEPVYGKEQRGFSGVITTQIKMPCVIGNGSTRGNCRGSYFAKWFIAVVKSHDQLIFHSLGYDCLGAIAVALCPIRNGKSFVEDGWLA